MADNYAPLCQEDGCGNATWEVWCHHHIDPAKRSKSRAKATRIASPYKPIKDNEFPTHSSLSSLWTNASKVFPDLTDIIHPGNLRSQALDAIKSAISTETHRLFPRLDVSDYQDRENRVIAARTYAREELSLRALDISDEDAVEIANSSSDQFGRAIDDSGALASYAVRLEWETANIVGVENSADGIPYKIPFNDFCDATAPFISAKIDEEFGKSLSGFDKFIIDNNGRPPLNIGILAPSIRLEPDYEYDPSNEYRDLMVQHDGILEGREQDAELAAQAQLKRDQRNAEFVGLGATIGRDVFNILRGGATAQERTKNKNEAAKERQAQSDRVRAAGEADRRNALMKEQEKFYNRVNKRK